MRKYILIHNKKRKLFCTAFLIFLAISTLSAVLANWTNYKNCRFAYDAGHIYYPNKIKEPDDSAAYIAFYTSWGKIKTDGYQFGIGTTTVEKVEVSLRAKCTMSYAEYYAEVFYNQESRGTSGWKMIHVGGYEYSVVTVDIVDTYCNPDNFVIYVRVAKSLCTVYMDHIRVSVQYESGGPN